MEKEINNIIERHSGKIGGLLAILQDIQLAFGYLSEEALKDVAEKTNRSLVDVFGLASSHSYFRLMPPEQEDREDEKGKKEIKCPGCNHSLMDNRMLIDNQPSVKITVSFGFEHGWLRLSSKPKSTKYESEYELPMKGEINYFCPHCHREIIRANSCDKCGSPMVPVINGRRFGLRCIREEKNIDRKPFGKGDTND